MNPRTRERPPGARERAAHGPVHHKGPGPSPSGWLDPRGRAVGGRSFAVHRITGIALVLYLYVHLGVLSMLLIGQSAWGDFLGIVTAKGFLAFDVVLIFAVLFHGLNGLRVSLVGSGFLVERQQLLFWIATAIGAPALLYAGLHVFEVI